MFVTGLLCVEIGAPEGCPLASFGHLPHSQKWRSIHSARHQPGSGHQGMTFEHFISDFFVYAASCTCIKFIARMWAYVAHWCISLLVVKTELVFWFAERVWWAWRAVWESSSCSACAEMWGDSHPQHFRCGRHICDTVHLWALWADPGQFETNHVGVLFTF